MFDLVKRIGDGETLDAIAFDWGRSRKTVEYFWSIAKAKLGIQCYQDATKYAIRHGLIRV